MCVLALGMIGIVKKITTTDGCEIPWVDEVRYLGIFIVRSIKFNVLLTIQNAYLFRAANGIFPKLAD